MKLSELHALLPQLEKLISPMQYWQLCQFNSIKHCVEMWILRSDLQFDGLYILEIKQKIKKENFIKREGDVIKASWH